MRQTWDDTWMQVGETIAGRSLCSRAQVGCVIVDDNQSVQAASYNGPPPGFEVSGMCDTWCPRAMGIGEISSDYSNCPSNHAEINGIARLSNDTNRPLTAYVNRLCCITCAKALASANIKRVVCKITTKDEHLNHQMITEYLSNCGVVVEMME